MGDQATVQVDTAAKMRLVHAVTGHVDTAHYLMAGTDRISDSRQLAMQVGVAKATCADLEANLAWSRK